MRAGKPAEAYQADRQWAIQLFKQNRIEDLPPSLRERALYAIAYNNGYSLEAIAENYNASYMTVRHYVSYFGCTLRSPGGRSPALLATISKKGARKC